MPLLLLLLCSQLLHVKLRLQLPRHLLIPAHLLCFLSINKTTTNTTSTAQPPT
jgi:hypothetical protein